MIAYLLMVVALLSVFFVPYVFVMLFAIVAGLFSPLVPFAVGIFADLLYLPPHTFPFMSCVGALASVVLFAVQRFVKTSIIEY